MNKGLDSAKSVQFKIADLVADGFTFVVRYYFQSSAFKDRLTADEAQAVSDAGAYTVSVWENGMPIDGDYPWLTVGIHDGVNCLIQARAAKQPDNTPIYFAVDFDAPPSLYGVIREYFSNLHSVFACTEYLPRCYGSRAVIDMLIQSGLIDKGWESGSKKWTDFVGQAPELAMVQGAEETLDGLDIDVDFSDGDAGGWKI